jgi:superoxide reductase
MKIFICQICGHIAFNEAPEKCPVCEAEKEKFDQNDAIFKESAAKSPEAAVKHEPAITVNKQCGLIPEASCIDIAVRIGKTLHPMEEKHFINFVDCYHDDTYIGRMTFTPRGLNPAACFHLKNISGKITVVEKCNLHGYWKADVAV